ncbi:MAG: hypothetical protein ACTTJZ_05515 [Sphaerochaetaceae bacterium]
MDHRQRRRKRFLAFLYTFISLTIVTGVVLLLWPRMRASGLAWPQASSEFHSAAEQDGAAVAAEAPGDGDDGGGWASQVSEAVQTDELVEAAESLPASLTELAAPAEPEIVEVEEPVEPEALPEKELGEIDDITGLEVTSVRVPVAPTVLEAFLEEPAAAWSGVAMDDDFFADFFTSGSDMVYEDGLQNPYLYVNDEYYGSVEVDMRDNRPYVSRAELSSLLMPILESGFYKEFFSGDEEYIGSDQIESHGVGFVFDPNLFALYLTFNAAQLPEQNVSVSSGGLLVSRKSLNITGAEEMEPASFSWASNLSFYMNMGYSAVDGSAMSRMFQASAYNMLSFCDLATDFSISAGNSGIYVGRFLSYFDFIDKDIRLSIGAVPVYSALVEGNPFGLSLEKNYSYGTGSRSGNRYEQDIVLEKDCTVYVYMNGAEVFHRRMKVGKYKLRDFAFVQGANRVEIWQVPDGVSMDRDDPSPEITILYFDMSYDSSLMAKGEYLWKFSYSFPSVADDGTLPGYHYIDLNGDRYVAKFSDFSTAWQASVGLSHVLTVHNLAALSGMREADGSYYLRFHDSLSAIRAFWYGTLTFGGQVQFARIPVGGAFGWDDDFSYSLSLSNKFNSEALAPLSLSMNYESASSKLTLNTGYSFGFKAVRTGISASAVYDFKREQLTWTAAVSLSASFRQGLSLSAGISSSSSMMSYDIPFKISVGLSMSLGPDATMSAKSDLGTMDAGLSWKPFGSKRSNVQLNMSGLDFADLADHTLSLGYSYYGNLFGASARQQFTNKYRSFRTSLSLSTALVFADGQFGMARSVSGSYLLIHPEGGMKDSSISVGKATASSSTEYPKVFGNILYSGLTLYQRNGIAIYGSDSSMFGNSGMFLVGMTPRPRQGYVKRISITPTVTVSAVLMHEDGSPFVQFSSPIYQVTESVENGVTAFLLEQTQDYLFTDDNGRFIQSNLTPGLYCIDLEADSERTGEKVWYGLFFEVPSLDRESQVILLDDFRLGDESADYVDKASDIYARSIMLNESSRMTEADFWDFIFSSDSAGFDDFHWTDEEAFSEDAFQAFDGQDGLTIPDNDVQYMKQDNIAP